MNASVKISLAVTGVLGRMTRYRDYPTRTFNSRYLDRVLDSKVFEARRASKSFALLFIDLDRFKAINDRVGHLSGTAVLQETARVLQATLRQGDLLFRYGGDEFVAVLSDCGIASATQLAERLRRAVADHRFQGCGDPGLPVTVSIGVAGFPNHATSKSELLHEADQALYRAKRLSQDAVAVART